MSSRSWTSEILPGDAVVLNGEATGRTYMSDSVMNPVNPWCKRYEWYLVIARYFIDVKMKRGKVHRIGPYLTLMGSGKVVPSPSAQHIGATRNWAREDEKDEGYEPTLMVDRVHHSCVYRVPHE